MEIATLDRLMRQLSEARVPSDFTKLATIAETMRAFAVRAGLGLAAQNRCAEVRLRAERGLGTLLVPVELRGRPKNIRARHDFKLADIGITPRVSHRAQRLAAIPELIFETYLRDAVDQGDEVTTRALLGVAERQTSGERNRQRIRGGAVADLVAFAAAGNRVGTILVDPPWPIEGASALLPYETISINDLKALPVPALCAERCHCHLWCLPNATIFRAEEILAAWGFRPVGIFTWGKSGPAGRGNYWRHSSEHIVTGVRSRDDRFDDKSLPSWIAAPREAHSEKPAAVYEMIERASPPPRIELFARTLRESWWAWGHEISGGVVAPKNPAAGIPEEPLRQESH
jgi:N6-adenosine-specific RNA methylase IME4